jgi:hypothetical protein
MIAPDRAGLEGRHSAHERCRLSDVDRERLASTEFAQEQKAHSAHIETAGTARRVAKQSGGPHFSLQVRGEAANGQPADLIVPMRRAFAD